MLISDVFPDDRSLMFFIALIQASACVADTICIAQSDHTYNGKQRIVG